MSATNIVEAQGEEPSTSIASPNSGMLNEQAIANAQRHFMHGPDGEPLRVDEVNFIDTSLIRYFASGEAIVAGPTRGTKRPGSRQDHRPPSRARCPRRASMC